MMKATDETLKKLLFLKPKEMGKDKFSSDGDRKEGRIL